MKPKEKRKFLIAFTYNNGTKSGSGNSYFETEDPITEQVIRDLQRAIADNHQLISVVISGWQRLED